MSHPHTEEKVMRHELEIKQCYLIRILGGTRTFEIRKNDRDFQAGDLIKFLPLEDSLLNVYEGGRTVPEYTITYVLAEVPGIEPGYVCLAIAPPYETN